MDNDLQNKWNWPLFITCNLLALLLFGSWALSQEVHTLKRDGKKDKQLIQYKDEGGFWKDADYGVFKALNGSLSAGKSTQTFWAVTNNRKFDLVSALLMIGLFSIFIFRGNTPGEKLERIKKGVYMSVCMLIIICTQKVISKVVGYQRHSPTQIEVPGYIKLSDFKHINFEIKDASKDSFPGDHSAILLIIGFFIAYYARSWYAPTAVLIAVSFVLPRIVGGGHWFTDVFVGGGTMLLLCVGWGLFTPLQDKISAKLNKPGLWIMGLASKIFPALKPPLNPQESN